MTPAERRRVRGLYHDALRRLDRLAAIWLEAHARGDRGAERTLDVTIAAVERESRKHERKLRRRVT